jgi:hypothetical protein
MLTDNLVGAIALDLLGAGIPIRDVALRIKHVDGVVSSLVARICATFTISLCLRLRFPLET